MHKTAVLLTGLTATFLTGFVVSAQTELAPPSSDKQFFFKTVSERGAMELNPVKGAPYAADQTTVTTQSLPDGNRIVQTSTAKVYRDQQGRTRIEHSLGSIGPLASSEKHTTILINDPVAGVHFNLEPENHTALKLSGLGSAMHLKLVMDKPGPDKAPAVMTVNVNGSDGVKVLTTYKSAADAKTNTEDLGAQTMEGLKVTGTRTTITIPAGGEGNELPMQITDEKWYSPDLQTNIKTIHTDPRMGQTVFSLVNVSRSNPDASLFQIPSDYQVVEEDR